MRDEDAYSTVGTVACKRVSLILSDTISRFFDLSSQRVSDGFVHASLYLWRPLNGSTHESGDPKVSNTFRAFKWCDDAISNDFQTFNGCGRTVSNTFRAFKRCDGAVFDTFRTVRGRLGATPLVCMIPKYNYLIKVLFFLSETRKAPKP